MSESLGDSNLALVYVEGSWAWFAEKPDEAWGDDWNDAPHYCNAGDPYPDRGGRLLKVAYDGDLEIAGDEYDSPPYGLSVEEINDGRLPWLYQPSYGSPQPPEPVLVIRAHTHLVDFEQLVAQAGGKVYRCAQDSNLGSCPIPRTGTARESVKSAD